MNYQLLGENNFHELDNILDTVLKNRGIPLEHKELFLNPNKKHEIHYSKLKDMDKAVQLFKKHINKDSNIVIVTDRDLDGFTSSASIHNYIQTAFPEVNVTNIQHIKRQNGLVTHVMKTIKQLHELLPIDLVILPDASSNDKEQHELLNSKGIDVLVLDHHEVSNDITESQQTVVVNPQLSPNYENKQISGAGVTYKFLQALDDEFEVSFADDNLELIAVGNIGDAMEMKHLDTRSIVYRGLDKYTKNQNTCNKFLKALVNKNLHPERQFSATALSWDVLPKINALIRIGTQEELQFIYEALLGYEGTFERTYRGKTIIENWENKAVRLCTNAQGRQRTARNKISDIVTQHIEENDLNKYSVIFAPIKDLETKGLTGYVAGNLVNKYGKPVSILLYDEETGVYSGSSRGLESLLEDYKEYLTNSGVCKTAGHANAHGVSIHEDDLDTLYKYLEDNPVKNSGVAVDFILDYSQVNSALIKKLDELEIYWGKGIEEPKFLIQNVELPMNIFDYRETVSKVKDRGKVLTAFSVPEDIKKNAKTDTTIVTDVVATLGINRFLQYIDDQILIESFNIKEIKEAQSDFGFLF